MNTFQINDEFCWMHFDFHNGGGWTCQHPDCVSREKILQHQKQAIADLKQSGYSMKRVGQTLICQSPAGFIYEIGYVDQLMDQLLFAQALPSSKVLMAEIIATIAEEIAIDRLDTDERRAINANV